MTSTVAENRIVAGIWAVGHIDANVRKQKDRDAGTWLTPFFFFFFFLFFQLGTYVHGMGPLHIQGGPSILI